MRVKTPPDTPAADYLVTIKALSDQTEPLSKDLRVTVVVSTQWGYFGVASLIIMLIVLIIVFKKLRR